MNPFDDMLFEDEENLFNLLNLPDDLPVLNGDLNFDQPLHQNGKYLTLLIL